MGILKNFKTWFDCKRTGRMDEYKNYKIMIESHRKDIIRFEGYIEDATKRLENLKSRGYAEDSKEVTDAKENLQRWVYALDEAKLELEYIRPNTKDDIEYRANNTGEKFIEALRQVKSDDLNLVFHGTPIYFAREILKTGKISSSADRYDGYVKSTDLPGEISVSDMDSLERTLDFFSGIASYQHCLPGGCIFAMHPKDDKDFNKAQSIMSSVDFKKNPEQLYGIFTTPENIPSVKKWLGELGLNQDLVYDFEGFVQAVKKTSKGIDGDNKLYNSIKVSEEVVKEVENRSHGNTNPVIETLETEKLEKDDEFRNDDDAK